MTTADGPEVGRRISDQMAARQRPVALIRPNLVDDPAPTVAAAAGESGGRDRSPGGQLRFAHRFVADQADRLLHVHGVGWHQYDGVRWAECRDGGQVRAVVDMVNAAYRDLGDLGGSQRADLLRDLGRVESAAGINGVLDVAANLHPCTTAADAMDADPLLLNTRSGTLHLDDGTVRPPHPADRLSKVTGAAFDPAARSDAFEAFLHRVQPDPAMRAFLARQLGAALVGRVRDHVLHIWHGTGANGKGTLRDAVRHALGDYVVEVPPDILLLNRYGQQAHAPDRMRLRGARLAFCSEIASGAAMNEATMKALTGGDPVNAKLLYRNPIEFLPSHTLFMLTNHLPRVSADDPATWRRIMAVPFAVEVPAAERDPQLPETLHGAADAILAWLWAGWLDYRDHGLNPPAAVREATERYRQDVDPLGRFLADEAVIVHGHGSVGSGELYGAFTEWCRAQGEPTDMTNKTISAALEKRGVTSIRTNKGRRWRGLMLCGGQ